MRYEDDNLAAPPKIIDASHALLLKRRVTDGQDFIDQ
jgi:hypothetical protein